MSFIIRSEPNLVVDNLGDILNMLKDGDSIVFVFPIRLKKNFESSIKRINKLTKYKEGGFSFVILSFLDEISMIINGRKSKELEHALLIYKLCWKVIDRFEGEEFSDNKVKVTFHGKGNPMTKTGVRWINDGA